MTTTASRRRRSSTSRRRGHRQSLRELVGLWVELFQRHTRASFAEYLRHLANYRSAAGSLLGFYFLTTYLYVGAIVLLVGIQLDELLLRKDVQNNGERGILELVRGVF